MFERKSGTWLRFAEVVRVHRGIGLQLDEGEELVQRPLVGCPGVVVGECGRMDEFTSGCVSS